MASIFLLWLLTLWAPSSALPQVLEQLLGLPGEVTVSSCCGQGEQLEVREVEVRGLFSRSKIVAECVPAEDMENVEGRQVWTEDASGDSALRILKTGGVRRPSCGRGLFLASVRVNRTEETQSNGTTLLVGSNLSLRGGRQDGEGNVYVGGQPVCDDDWDNVDAKVACRELGYSSGKATSNSRFGPAPGGDFGMDDVACQGYEERLEDCDHAGQDDCGEDEAAGVVCGFGGSEDGEAEALLSSEGELLLLDNEDRATEFCLASGFTKTLGRQERSLEQLVALGCDRCVDQVLCTAAKALFGSYSFEQLDEATIVSIGDKNGDNEVDFEELFAKLKHYTTLLFKNLDENDDGSLLEEAKRGDVLKKFSLGLFQEVVTNLIEFFDSNKDGSIGLDDAWFDHPRRYQERQDGEFTLSDMFGMPLISLPGPLYNLYSQLDKDGDEKLSREEATDFIARTFAVIDANADCYIGEDEVVALLQKVGVPGDMVLAVRMVLQQYLGLGSFLAQEFLTRADMNQDDRVTIEEVFGFNDWDFINSTIPVVTDLGRQGGSLDHLVGTGYYSYWSRQYGREAAEQAVALWLSALQSLLEQPAYSGSGQAGGCAVEE